jgi:hypothetical protein
MTPSVRSKAEERFARKAQRDQEVVQENAMAARKIAEKIDRLRALRLARAASDRESAARAAAGKVRPPNRKAPGLTADASGHGA